MQINDQSLPEWHIGSERSLHQGIWKPKNKYKNKL